MDNNNNNIENIKNNNEINIDKDIEKLKYLSICKGKILSKFETIISRFNNYNNDLEKANGMFNELKEISNNNKLNNNN